MSIYFGCSDVGLECIGDVFCFVYSKSVCLKLLLPFWEPVRIFEGSGSRLPRSPFIEMERGAGLRMIDIEKGMAVCSDNHHRYVRDIG